MARGVLGSKFTTELSICICPEASVSLGHVVGLLVCDARINANSSLFLEW